MHGYCNHELAITHASQIVRKLHDVGQDHDEGRVVSNHGYNGYPGTDL